MMVNDGLWWLMINHDDYIVMVVNMFGMLFTLIIKTFNINAAHIENGAAQMLEKNIQPRNLVIKTKLCVKCGCIQPRNSMRQLLHEWSRSTSCWLPVGVAHCKKASDEYQWEQASLKVVTKYYQLIARTTFLSLTILLMFTLSCSWSLSCTINHS